MTDQVKVRVNDHHFKNKYSLGEKTVGKEEPEKVEVNNTVRNAVQAGTLELIEGSLSPERDEKEFQENEQSGAEGEEDDESDFSEMTVDELKQRCEEKDLKKSGTKDELIERLKNSE